MIRLKRRIEVHPDKLTDIQRVILNSRVNGAVYTGEELPVRKWKWPTETFLSRRLRKEQPCTDR